MSPALIAALGWLALANVIGMLPSRSQHWPAAHGLIAIGTPLLVWLFLSTGWLATLIFLLAAGSVLRWPVVYSARWIRARIR